MTDVNLREKERPGSRSRWHTTDAWRGYLIPPYAIAGTSYTGEWPDSPAPLHEVKPPVDQLRRYLKEKGIETHIMQTPSSNLFMVKFWITASPDDYEKAIKLAEQWMNSNPSIEFIHAIDGKEISEEANSDYWKATSISDKRWDEAFANTDKLGIPEVKDSNIMQLLAKHAEISVPLLKRAEEKEQITEKQEEEKEDEDRKKLKA